jgi:hypothetical protein
MGPALLLKEEKVLDRIDVSQKKKQEKKKQVIHRQTRETERARKA